MIYSKLHCIVLAWNQVTGVSKLCLFSTWNDTVFTFYSWSSKIELQGYIENLNCVHGPFLSSVLLTVILIWRDLCHLSKEIKKSGIKFHFMWLHISTSINIHIFFFFFQIKHLLNELIKVNNLTQSLRICIRWKNDVW